MTLDAPDATRAPRLLSRANGPLALGVVALAGDSAQARTRTPRRQRPRPHPGGARGGAGTGSDIDVLVVRPASIDPTGPAWQTQLSQLEDEVYAWTGNPLLWIETTQADLERALDNDEPVLRSWRDDAIHLTGTHLHPLLRTTATS